jgi:hypothetical protein
MVESLCQIECLESLSRPTPPVMAAALRLAHSIERNGVLPTVKQAGRSVLTRVRRLFGIRRQNPRASPGGVSYQPLHLQPGEWVEVRPETEIQATLDSTGRCQGLLFMPGMSRHCSRRFRVKRRLEQMVLESTLEIRRVRDTVLLEDAMCEGVGIRCDRSCFFFWREAWLRRASPPAPQRQSQVTLS